MAILKYSDYSREIRIKKKYAEHPRIVQKKRKRKTHPMTINAHFKVNTISEKIMRLFSIGLKLYSITRNWITVKTIFRQSHTVIDLVICKIIDIKSVSDILSLKKNF